MKKRLISLSLGIVMVLSLTVAASAAWSADTVLDVPGWNGSKTFLYSTEILDIATKYEIE